MCIWRSELAIFVCGSFLCAIYQFLLIHLFIAAPATDDPFLWEKVQRITHANRMLAFYQKTREKTPKTSELSEYVLLPNLLFLHLMQVSTYDWCICVSALTLTSVRKSRVNNNQSLSAGCPGQELVKKPSISRWQARWSVSHLQRNPEKDPLFTTLLRLVSSC